MRPAPCLSLLALALLPPTLAAQEPPPGKEEKEKKEKKAAIPELPEILVIGRRQQDGVPEVPLRSIGSRDVFGPEDIRATGARDLNDLVQHLPAVSTRPYNGGEAAAPSFSMRGLPDDGLTEYIQILVDGVPASALPYGWTAFSFLPITTERVYAMDYIRGGHAVRYSPNTVGGVLNFITRPIPDEPVLEMRSTLGSFDYSSTMLRSGGTVDGTGILLTYVDRRGDGYRRDGGFDQQDLNLKLRFDLGEGDWLAASLSYMEDEHQAPGGLTQAEFAADRFANARPGNRFDGYRGLLDLVHHQVFGSGWLETFAYASETGRHLRARRPHFGTATSVSDWDDESFFSAAGFRVQQEADFLGMEHSLYGGVRVLREWIPAWKMRSEPFPGGPGTLTQDASFRTLTLSAHVDDTFEPLPDLTLVLGVRGEWIPSTGGNDAVAGWTFEDEFSALLPGVGASYAFTDHWAVFANYNEGFRAPQVWGYAFTAPGASLVFEKGRSQELGTRVVDLSGIHASLAAWRTEYDDFGVFYTGFYENLGSIVANGVDLVLEWQAGELLPVLDGFSFYGALTLQDSELRSGPNAGNETPYAWERKGSWRFRYDLDPGWSFSLGGVYVGESFADETNTTVASADGTLGINPSWTLWDARVARRFALGEQADVEVAVGATNLFDRDWNVHSRGGFFGGGLVAGPPRQAYFAVSLALRW